MSLKKIIAREGLIVIIWIIFLAESALWAADYKIAALLISNKLVPTKGILFPAYFYARAADILFLLAYPVYLFFRFVIWAVTTLTEK